MLGSSSEWIHNPVLGLLLVGAVSLVLLARRLWTLRAQAGQIGDSASLARRERIFRLDRAMLRDVTGTATLGLPAFCEQVSAADRPTLGTALSELERTGSPFQLQCGALTGGTLDIAGQVRGAFAFVSVVSLGMPQRAAGSGEDDATALLQAAPILSWTLDAAQSVRSTNARAGCEGIPVELRRRGAELSRDELDGCHRVEVAATDGGAPHHYDLHITPAGQGEALLHAVPVDRLVKAEAALNRFVETLTETFAHLPIGLAIFGKARELGLFNPALAELLRLDPAWLAGRPSLPAFLNHLRERQTLPDRRDFREWREQLVKLGRDGGPSEFSEVWVQSSGRTLRIVGRPHPQGAIAFLLEDITPAVTLEQQYREGMQLRDAALDLQPDAQAIFDVSGAMPFANAAFRALLDNAEEAKLAGAGAIREVARRCAEQFGEGRIWDDLRQFVTDPRAGDTADGSDGVLLRATQGATSVELRDLTGGATMLTLAPRVDVHVPTLSDLLRDGVSQFGNTHPDLGIEVDLPPPDRDIPVHRMDDLVRRTVRNLLLAASDTLEPETCVAIHLCCRPDAAVISLRCPDVTQGLSDIAETLPITLLRRYLADVGGELFLPEGGTLRIDATIPLAILDLPRVSPPRSDPACEGVAV
ncbi:PAS-domain containing protein [Roseobacter sp. HKCCA0434]|uniref:PAS-domain containing protein n=1 Tax=Roseobacter sp. HKCCA0434 TaxID=3079297 RepID=UPI002905D331|nr:PAS-domain containing protein [Roseobacter sp. HKCCA0434]